MWCEQGQRLSEATFMKHI